MMIWTMTSFPLGLKAKCRGKSSKLIYLRNFSCLLALITIGLTALGATIVQAQGTASSTGFGDLEVPRKPKIKLMPPETPFTEASKSARPALPPPHEAFLAGQVPIEPVAPRRESITTTNDQSKMAPPAQAPGGDQTAQRQLLEKMIAEQEQQRKFLETMRSEQTEQRRFLENLRQDQNPPAASPQTAIPPISLPGTSYQQSYLTTPSTIPGTMLPQTTISQPYNNYGQTTQPPSNLTQPLLIQPGSPQSTVPLSTMGQPLWPQTPVMAPAPAAGAGKPLSESASFGDRANQAQAEERRALMEARKDESVQRVMAQRAHEETATSQAMHDLSQKEALLQKAKEERQRVEQAMQKVMADRAQAEQLAQKVLEERAQAEATAKKAQEERALAEQAAQRAMEKRAQAEELAKRALEERAREEAAAQQALAERTQAEQAAQRALAERAQAEQQAKRAMEERLNAEQSAQQALQQRMKEIDAARDALQKRAQDEVAARASLQQRAQQEELTRNALLERAKLEEQAAQRALEERAAAQQATQHALAQRLQEEAGAKQASEKRLQAQQATQSAMSEYTQNRAAAQTAAAECAQAEQAAKLALQERGQAEQAAQRAMQERTVAENVTQKALEDRAAAEKAIQEALQRRTQAEEAARKALEERTAAEQAAHQALMTRAQEEQATQKAMEDTTRVQQAAQKALEEKALAQQSVEHAMQQRSQAEQTVKQALQERTLAEQATQTALEKSQDAQDAAQRALAERIQAQKAIDEALAQQNLTQQATQHAASLLAQPPVAPWSPPNPLPPIQSPAGIANAQPSPTPIVPAMNLLPTVTFPTLVPTGAAPARMLELPPQNDQESRKILEDISRQEKPKSFKDIAHEEQAAQKNLDNRVRKKEEQPSKPATIIPLPPILLNTLKPEPDTPTQIKPVAAMESMLKQVSLEGALPPPQTKRETGLMVLPSPAMAHSPAFYTPHLFLQLGGTYHTNVYATEQDHDYDLVVHAPTFTGKGDWLIGPAAGMRLEFHPSWAEEVFLEYVGAGDFFAGETNENRMNHSLEASSRADITNWTQAWFHGGVVYHDQLSDGKAEYYARDYWEPWMTLGVDVLATDCDTITLSAPVSYRQVNAGGLWAGSPTVPAPDALVERFATRAEYGVDSAWRRRWTTRLETRASLAYLYDQYDRPSLDEYGSMFSGAGVRADQTDHLWEAALGAGYAFADRNAVGLRYRYRQNGSNGAWHEFGDHSVRATGTYAVFPSAWCEVSLKLVGDVTWRDWQNRRADSATLLGDGSAGPGPDGLQTPGVDESKLKDTIYLLSAGLERQLGQCTVGAHYAYETTNSNDGSGSWTDHSVGAFVRYDY